ncbi:MAG: DUF3267 domain-containing protein [Balneolaceae bacterium]|nr:DUF3267 domain-containing protein [Balneolaceae bacterium]
MDKVIPENEINSPDAPVLDGYLLKDSLEHQNITGFITPWLNKKNPFTLFYKGSLFVGFMIIGGLAGYFLTSEVMSISTILFHFFGGVFLSFFLIPLHEWLHGIGYRIAGAKNIEYKAVWKQFVFYALADKFVTDYKSFRLVAMMPFVCITTLFIFLIFILPGQWIILLSSVLVSHAGFCVGDFVLLGYMYEHRDEGILTLDVLEHEKSYFYVKNKN